MRELADRELVELGQRGDLAAIGELFSRYWRAARAAAFAVTGEVAAAEDAAAEAFKEACAGMGSLRDPDRFASWLRTIVVRKARILGQNRQAPLDSLTDQPQDSGEPLDDVLERLQLGALVKQAIRELSEPLREAIALVYFEGYESEAAASFLGIPAGTLRRRLHDGRAQLRIAVGQILERRTPVNEERERQLQKLRTMIESGEIYGALRGMLALRPVPTELFDAMLRQKVPANDLAGDHEMIQRQLQPSERAHDPGHPVGSIAAAIRKALPDFQDWPLNTGSAVARLLFARGEYRDRVQALLPPGFAEGRPGAFMRTTRAMVLLNEGGSMRSIFEHLQNSPDQQTFAGAKNKLGLSDAIDLTWMVVGALELRSVQEMLERLVSTVLPGAQIRFSTYDEPRYRAALQFQVGDVSPRAGYGGVLAEWPGRPGGVDAAHVRIFLEPWATLQSGQVVAFDPPPDNRDIAGG